MRFSCFALALFFVAFSASAEDYPTRSVRLLVGYPPRTLTDVAARVIAVRLREHWNQSVSVENRRGRAGNFAAAAVAKAPGDGYTLLFAPNGLAISAATLPNLPYKPETDLLPLAFAGTSAYILVVAPEFAAKNVQELIARAKAEPGKLAFASSGVGNYDHLNGQLFNLMAGIKAVHVPYQGAVPASTDLIAGRVAYYFAPMPTGLQLLKSRQARALGVTSTQRLAAVPDIPTISEQGVPGYEGMFWLGLFAPASIRSDLAARITRDVQTVLAQPDTRAKLQSYGVTLLEEHQADFRRYYHSAIEKWRNVAKKGDIQFE